MSATRPTPGRSSRRTGCPKAGPVTIERGQRCVPLPGELKFIYTAKPGGACVGNDYVQIELVRGLDGYEAVWLDSYGSRWWASPGTVWPHRVTGEGASYAVPKGDAAWSGGGGASGDGDCPGPPGSEGVRGFGITAKKYLVSGLVTKEGTA